MTDFSLILDERETMSISTSELEVSEANRAASAFVVTNKNQPLHDSVRQALESYLVQLKGQSLKNLYELVLAEVEVPLLEAVMEYTKGNQSRAAILMGLSRGTLRKKLKIYGMLD
jgi:Fis family transcriptional regulator